MVCSQHQLQEQMRRHAEAMESARMQSEGTIESLRQKMNALQDVLVSTGDNTNPRLSLIRKRSRSTSPGKSVLDTTIRVRPVLKNILYTLCKGKLNQLNFAYCLIYVLCTDVYWFVFHGISLFYKGSWEIQESNISTQLPSTKAPIKVKVVWALSQPLVSWERQ